MQDVNVLSISGRLTKDAVIKYTPSGMAIGSFSVASNSRVKKGDEWVDQASFFDCTMFGRFIETVAIHLTKGKQVFISGRLKQERWETDGKPNSKIVVIVEDVVFTTDKQSSQTTSQQPPNSFTDNIPF